MSQYNLLTFLITAGALAIGVSCFVKNKTSLVNFLYLSITILLVGFIAVLHLGYFFIDKPDISLFFIRLTFSLGTLGAAAICAFSYLYLRKPFPIPWIVKALYVVLTVGLTVISSTTGWVYEREIIVKGIEIQDVHGPLHLFFVLYYFCNLLLALFFLSKKMQASQSIERIKIKLVMWGITSLVIPALIFHMILPCFGVYIWQTEVVYFYLVFIFLTGYSMLRYRFLNVKFTITRFVRHGVAMLLSMLFVTGLYGIGMLFPFFAHNQMQVLPVLYIVAIFMYFYILRGLVSDMFYRVFGLTSIEQFRHTLHHFTQQSKLYETVDEFRMALDEMFYDVQIDCVDLISFNTKNQEQYDRFVKYFLQHPEILVQNELEFLPNPKIKTPHLASLGGVYIPLFYSPKKLLGMLILGEKSLGDLYSQEEIRLLEEFKHFLELRMISIVHSDYLKQEVKKKTKELKQKNTDLKQSNEKLQVLDQAKDTFLSIASHELRTPMTVIGGFSDLLLSDKKGKLTKKQKEFLSTISQSSKELTILVNKMLDISALEAGRMEFEWNDVAFPLCLEKIMKEYAVLAKEKKISLTLENPDNVNIIFKSDSLKIKQVMGNLLGNALKFTPEKGTVRILLEKGDTLKSSVSISVIDTGIGIPKKEQAMIFQKFHRTMHSRSTTFSGSGLGLHIVQLLVEKLGGEISVVSSKDKGSCFTFSLKGHK